MSKDLWFRLYEEELNRLEDEGLHPDLARDQASEYAFTAQREALEDAADQRYQQMKDDRDD